jgi:uncharacterized protein YdhG (YjbR/CyaY superfamily)
MEKPSISSNSFDSIDSYIASFPEAQQAKLQTLRETIKASAPEAEEKISYNMPTFAFKGVLVHFAMHKNHIGFYPIPSGIEAFEAELARYECSKGAVRFPLDQDLPLDLIRRIVQFRLAENLHKAALKADSRRLKR